MRTFLSPLILLVLLVSCQQGPSAEVRQRIDSLQAANQDMEQRLQRMSEEQASVERTTLTPHLYFRSGRAWLSSSEKEKLADHAQAIKEQYPGATIQVKGFSDQVPIGPALETVYPSNWHLSAQRAATVVHLLEAQYDLPSDAIGIDALGAPSQVEPGETPEAHRQNRRVEIVVVEDSP